MPRECAFTPWLGSVRSLFQSCLIDGDTGVVSGEPEQNPPSSIFLPCCSQCFTGGRQGLGLCRGLRCVLGGPSTACRLLLNFSLFLPYCSPAHCDSGSGGSWLVYRGGDRGFGPDHRGSPVMRRFQPTQGHLLSCGQPSLNTLGNPAPHPGS